MELGHSSFALPALNGRARGIHLGPTLSMFHQGEQKRTSMSDNIQLRLRLLQLWNEWDIRVPVLLSFGLQLFLFFTGGLRRRSSKLSLRFSIWLAYLGADMIAFYALGQISRLGDAIHERYPFTGKMSMAFYWAPFLLVHLGGQDTITAFSSEDNDLWLRHLMNLLVEISLSLYVFWKSVGHSKKLLISATFVFVSGIIKYGERIWALKYGSNDDLDSTSTNYENDRLPLLSLEKDRYSDMVSYALHTARYVRAFLAGRATFQMGHEAWFTLEDYFGRFVDHESKVKIIEMELGIVYDDLYTKAMVLRTWTGIICRCVVLLSTVAAFNLFHHDNKRGYSGVDVAITYTLLIGSISMELFSVVMAMLSPWTWAYFKARNLFWFTHMSWSVLKTLWPQKKRWWSNSIGQYNLLSSMVTDGSPNISMTRKMITFKKMTRKMMCCIGLHKFWRRLQHTKHVDAKEKILACIVQWLDDRGRFQDLVIGMKPKLGTEMERILRGPFEHVILQLHLFTDYHIRRLRDDKNEAELNSTGKGDELDLCEQMSDYMLYLLVTNPFMLPVSSTSQDTLALFPEKIFSSSKEGIRKALDKDWKQVGESEGKILLGARALLDYPKSELSTTEKLLVEIKEIWIRLLVYAAGRSRAESHAKQMSKGGGELLTFIWLLMGAHYQLGDVACALDLVSTSTSTSAHTGDGHRFSAFRFTSNEQSTSV